MSLSTISAQVIIWEEDFETCGNTVNCGASRYTSANDFFGGASDYFGRIRSNEDFYLTDATNGNKIQITSGGYSGQNGNYYYAAEDLDDTNPLEGNADAQDFKDLTFTGIPIAGGTNLEFRGLFARGETDVCGTASVYDALDFVELYHNVDNAGEVKALCFNADLDCQGDTFNEALHHDPNCDGNGSDGVALTHSFATYTFSIPTGSTLDIRIRVSMDGSSEEFAFDYFRVFSNTPLLPVELTSFEGYTTSEGKQLLWETASEQNNDYFAIERSYDAKQFEMIGKVPGYGTTAEPQQYAFLDEQEHFHSIIYYRLRQVDFDGQLEYSKIVAIRNALPEESTVEISPNPSANYVRFTLPTSLSSDLTLIIYSALGQEITTIIPNQNSSSVELDVSSWNAGVYYVFAKKNQQLISTQKLIIH
ncbi:MAG: T9SS type A sorting domain-containing protein [Bacteroidota bacterium]